MHARNRWMLRTQPRVWVPAGVEENKDGADVMLRGDGQKLVDATPETLLILLPRQVVEEHAHGVHANAFSPAEFAVDLVRIEGVRLPHLELVNCIGWYEIRAHRPGLLGI